LQPQFTTDFKRATVELDAGGARIELAFDQGTIGAGARREPIRELEFELIQGDFRLLLESVRGLIPRLALELEVRSKAERGYRLATAERTRPVKAERPAIDAEDDARNAIASVVGSCVSQVAANTRGAAVARDPEYLHQLRVGLRRLRSALRVFRGLAPPESTQRLVESLRGVLPSLGVARDWDVVTDLLEQRIAPGAGDAIDFAATLRWARRRRLRARRDARAIATSSEFQLLLIDAMIWAEQAREAAVAAPAEGAAEAEPRPGLATYAKRMTRRLARKVEQSGDRCDWSDGSARHQVRIRLKRLRYACEFFADCFKRKRVRRYLEHLEALQDLLGELNDLATARQLFVDPTGAQGVQGAFVRGWLSAREDALVAALAAAWGAFRDQPRPA